MMNTADQKIAIVGKGAIGSLLAYQCQVLDFDYQLLLRKQSKVLLNIEDITGQQHRMVAKTSTIGQPSPFDIVILPVKAYQVHEALQQLHEHIQTQHIIVLLHNGMGSIESVTQLFPKNPLIIATTSYGVFKPNDQNLKITGLGHTHLGWLNIPDPAIKNTTEYIMSALLPPSTWHSDITLALWNKLAINAVINPLTAIYNIKNGQLANAKFSRQIVQVCDETALIMTAIGFSKTSVDLQKSVTQVIAATAENYSSMHQDIAFNRRTEIDAISGYIVQQGQQYGIHTPANLRLLQEIKQLEQST